MNKTASPYVYRKVNQLLKNKNELGPDDIFIVTAIGDWYKQNRPARKNAKKEKAE